MQKIEPPKDRVFYSVGDKVCSIDRPDIVYEIVHLCVQKQGEDRLGYFYEDVAVLERICEPTVKKNRVRSCLSNSCTRPTEVLPEPELETPTILQYYDDVDYPWVCFVKKDWYDRQKSVFRALHGPTRLSRIRFCIQPLLVQVKNLY